MLPFSVVINEPFASHCTDSNLKPTDNKHVLIVVNGFEDGEWRFGQFQDFVWNNVSETALRADERAALYEEPSTLLRSAAGNLRLIDSADDKTGGSEIAEIVLYAIMKKHYGALAVVPKIFYKQNKNDYAKGADSVHIVLTPPSGFTLWFGESKFYKSIENTRLGPIISSIEEMLTKEKIKKENSIILGVSDLKTCVSDQALLEQIRQSLDPATSIDNIKPILNIPILLLHQCDLTDKATEYSKEYERQIREKLLERANGYFKKQIEELGFKVHKYGEIRFHLILFPVPEKSKIVTPFISKAKALKK